MGLFDFWKKKKVQLTDKQKRWNQMWALWTEEKVDAPYAALMTYQSEINNGGHAQYFSNQEDDGDLPNEMLALESILPSKLKENLKMAYEAYRQLVETEEDEQAEAILEQCDNVFYENEKQVDCILEEYAETIVL